MFKKFILILLIISFVPCAHAIDRSVLNPEFFKMFNDDCLYYYINEAIENNHSAKQATLRVEQYRQMAKSSLGKELPSFSVAANYLGIHVPMLDNFTLSENAFVLPFIANYEADFLLKNRDKTKSVKKIYEISQEEEKTIYLALLTDVATAYTNLLEYDKLVQSQNELVEISKIVLNNDLKKFERGIINSTELNNSKKNLENAETNLSNFEKQREIILMQLAVLTGKSPVCNNFNRGNLDDFEYQGSIPCQIGSDVIFSRPDVIAAEKNLEKAKIDIRVARKEFLPRFNITGFWVFNSLAGGTFFSWESSIASILAGATQDIFKGGQKIANLKLQKAKYEELFEKYRQIDLEGVKEVNTALCLIKHDTEIFKNKKLELEYESQNFENADKMLRRGVISNNEYLNAKSKVLLEEIETSKAKTQRLVNYYTLYKATGGRIDE